MKITPRTCACKSWICKLAYPDLVDTKEMRRMIANTSAMEGENLYDLMTMGDAHVLALRLKYSTLKEEAIA